jgi:hypothetical protein
MLGSFRNFRNGANLEVRACGGDNILPFPGEHGNHGGEDPVTSMTLTAGDLLLFAACDGSHYSFHRGKVAGGA